MSNANEIQDAVDRLKQYGDGLKRFPPYHGGDHCLQRDLRVVADAYLALGTRQPSYIKSDTSGRRVAILTTFIQEIPEVPSEATQQSPLTFDQLSRMADVVNTDKWDELPEDRQC